VKYYRLLPGRIPTEPPSAMTTDPITPTPRATAPAAQAPAPTSKESAASDPAGGSTWLRPRWAYYLAFALLLGLYLGFNQAIGLRNASVRFATWKPFVWEMSSAWVVVALIPVIRLYERRFQLDSRPRQRIVFAHVTGAVAFSILHVTGMVLLRKLTYALAGESYDFGNIPVASFYELQKDLITYLTILVVLFAIREFRVRRVGELRARELAAQLSEARLHHLTAQIEPHFLFNTLNAISNRMHEDVDAADRMISQLGDLLRAAYESDDSVLVPLGREIGWLRGYAAMMAERFRGHLAFEVEVEPEIEQTLVPRLLLQPIVENAIRHGLKDGHGWLRVDVRRNGGRLQYTVSDDGAGLPDTPPERGTGLSNIERRLELLFPSDHSLTFESREPRGVNVMLSFPAPSS
jgi:two-component system, LytTR family, sensor kinase